MNDRAVVKMVEAIRGSKKGKAGGADTAVMLAKVSSVSPLTIKTSDATISKNIYINPAYIQTTSISSAFANAPDPAALFNFLKQFHTQHMISAGDTVLVIQIGVSFYIAEKVVKQA